MRKVVLKIDRKHSAFENATIVLDQGKQQTIFICLFTVLYLFRDLVGANVPDIVFSGLCAVAFMLADMGTSLGMYIFTTALTVPHNEIIIVYQVIMIFKILASGKVRVNGRLLLMTLGMLLLQLVNLTMFSVNAVGDVIYEYATRMLLIIVPLYWYNDEYTAEDFRSALLCYVAGVVLGGTVTMILTAELITWEKLIKGTGGSRLGKTWSIEEGMQTTYNCNQLAVMCAIAIAIILQHMDKKRISKVLGFLLLGYAMFITVLTRSRAGLLVIAMAIIIYYFILVIRRKKLLAGFFLLGLVGALIFIAVTFLPDMVDAVVERFVGEEDITNGRVEIFIFYIQKWVADPWCFLFGYGIGSFYDELGVNISPHNSVTDILISWGLIGILLVSGIILMCYNKGIKNVNRKDRIIALLPAMVALVASMAEQYLAVDYPHMRLCFLVLAAKAWETEKKEEKPKAIKGCN